MLLTFNSREEWLLARRQYIGSSDAGVLWGRDACYASQSPYSLYCQKVDGQEPQWSKSELRRLRKGQLLEPYIREICAEELGVELHVDPPHSFRTPLTGIVAASLDAWYEVNCEIIPVELKHVGPHNANEWDGDGLPLKFQVQVSHQMMVLDAPYGYVCGLCDDELFVRRVERDLEWEALHSRLCHDFMLRAANQQPPEIDGSDATTEAVKTRWKREKGPRVEVGDWLDKTTRQIERLESRAKWLDERIDARKNTIKEAIGEAEGCMSPGGCEWTWKTQERKEYVVAASSSRVLRRSGKRKGAR